VRGAGNSAPRLGRDRERRLLRWPGVKPFLLTSLVVLAGTTPIARAARPTPGALAPDRIKLPAGPNSVRGLADEPTVDPFYAQIGYAVSIDVPAGYGKLAPALALTYSGALGNGPLGIGWSMPGTRIERSLRLGVPTFTDADELEISGAVSGRLIAISATEYRVEGRGQTVRVRRTGAGFTVDLGDGTRLVLGVTAAARQESDPAHAVAWLVEEESNLAGERVVYTYERDGNQLYPSQITWGPHEVYRVDFSYLARPDVAVSFREGFRVETARRLDRIRITAAGTERRAYQLGYDDTFPVTRLARVSSTGKAGAGAWPQLDLGYATPGAPAVAPMPGVGSWRLNSSGVSLVDLDGDGAAELLALADGGHSYRVNQNGSFGPALPLTGNTQSITALQLMDVDGDARADLVQDTGAGWTVWKWSRTKWLATQPAIWPGTTALALKNPATTRFADVNGDGLVDAIQWNNDELHIFRATRTGYLPAVAVPRIAGALLPAPAGRFQDANGDGLDDYLVLQPGSLDIYLGRGDGTFEPVASRPYPFAGTLGNPDDVHLVDLDRDDLLDLVRVDLGTVRWFRGAAAGGFTTTPVTVPNPEPLSTDVVVTVSDVNGNGSQDLVWSSATNMWRLDVAGPTTAGMLVRAANGLGAVTRFGYRSAHELSVEARLAADPWQYEVPIAMPVPVQKLTELGAGEPTRRIDYLVRDGYWDADERRFGGFLGGVVTTWGATPAQTSSIQRRYHNGAGQNRALRGKLLVEQVRDGTGRRLSMTSNTWEAMPIAGLPDVPLLRAAALREIRVRNEDTTPLVETRETREYDAAGRLRRAVVSGRLDLDHDDLVRELRYADDDTTWVRDLPCEEKVRSATGELVAHTIHRFGDATTVKPLYVAGAGWPRETLAWLASESRFVSQSSTSYDAHGNPVTITDRGVTRRLDYDADALFPVAERIVIGPTPADVLTWRTTWDPVLGVPVTQLDPNDHLTTVTYDALGRATALALDAGLPHTYFQYDWTAPSPKTTTFVFDGPVTATTPFGSPGWRQIVDVANGTGQTRYRATRRGADWIIRDYTERDPNGRVVFHGQPTYSPVLDLTARPAAMTGDALTYDPLGRLIEQRSATGARRTLAYSAFERTSREDGLATVRSVFDGQGRVFLTSRTSAAGATETIEARYDAAGRIVRTTLGGGTVVREFTYDTLGRAIATRDPDLGARTLVWDDGDRLTRETNATGQVVRYGYDAAGRLVARDTGAHYAYHYDVPRDPSATGTAGRIAWIEEPTGTVDLGYDALGRLAFAARAIDDRTASETTTYSASGLVLARAHDDGVTIDYAYDAAGRAIAAGGDLWQALDLDAAGKAIDERFRNQAAAHYRRDAGGHLAALTLRDGAAQPILDLELARTPWGGIATVTDRDGVGLDHAAAFTYDDFARLTAATIGTGKRARAFGYGYDTLHNLVARTAPEGIGFAGAFRHGEGGHGPRQLTSIADPSDAVTHTFAYDAAGREVARDDLRMTYDASDRLLLVEDLPGGGVVAHAYGHDGLRVKTTAPDGAVTYWFSSGTVERAGTREHAVDVDGRVVATVKLVEEHPLVAADRRAAPVVAGLAGLVFALAFAARRRRRRWLGAGAMLLVACAQPATSTVRQAVWGGEAWTFHHTGIAAGPVVFTDGAGQVVEERRYEPFGAPIDARVRDGHGGYDLRTPDFASRDHDVLGHRTEVATGWSDHGARWMTTDAARWLTPDPPVQAPDPSFMYQPWNLHPYHFAAQNPVIYWDPDGNQPKLVEPAPSHPSAMPPHSPHEGTANVLHVVIELAKVITEGAIHNHHKQQRAFERLENRAQGSYILPIINAERDAAVARGSVPLGDDIKMFNLHDGSELLRTARVGIAEALRTGNQGALDGHVRMLQVKLRGWYNHDGTYYTVNAASGAREAVPYDRYPKVPDKALRKGEGYGPQAICTPDLNGANCSVR
jgi:RHS repeat-associated protein